MPAIVKSDMSAVDLNSPGLDARLSALPEWSAPETGYATTEADHTLKLDAGPNGFVMLTGATATVRVPAFKDAPFLPGMKICVQMDTAAGRLTLAPKPGVRLVLDEDVASLTVFACYLQNLGRDLWLVMRGTHSKAYLAGTQARHAANIAAGLPFWWPRDERLAIAS